MRIPVVLIVAAILVGAPETHAEQTSVIGRLRLAPQGEPRASQNSGKSNPYRRLFEQAGQAKDARPVPAPDRTIQVRLAPQDEPRASQNSGKSNPYSRLFGHAGQAKNARPVPPPDRTIQRPVVKCGMTLSPGDPQIDPGIVVPTNKSSARAHIRGIEPSTCW